MSPITTHFAGLSITQLAEQFGTPVYVYDAAMIRQRVRDLAPFDVVRYAQKACSNLSILRLVREEGALVDAVSAGEIARALAAGYAPSPQDHDDDAIRAGHHPAIVYTADVFDRASLDAVLEHDLPVNCGSPDMIDQYGERCHALGRRRGVTLRINPGFGHGHSQKVNTGGEGSKHGVWHTDVADCVRRAERWGLRVTGIHMHIGSGTDMTHLGKVGAALEQVAQQVGTSVLTISAGGGLSTPYRGDEPSVDVAAYYETWNAVREQLAASLGHAVNLEIEPGRYLAAESGALLTEVRAVKRQGSVEYVLVDAGFNNLVRPAMYGAYHPIGLAPANADSSGDAIKTPAINPEASRERVIPQSAIRNPQSFVVAGPLCESGDVFTQKDGGFVEARPLPRPAVGDLLVIGAAGAYGYTMASNYNSKPLSAEVLVENGEPRLIRRAQTVEDLLQHEI
ncbi:Diaminopimelate decarboxylase [Botrimarina colliarenosi]|uniref:Diaminopimelate decarboxylase n=1 Tax=Botrimarina colliarenosi TaxID=2528001 RepID=A0A5C6A638_9BACT|nr:diaminopimelate decarboxylase [Botrimarina colliarenosi]TWT94835.1 Diaminopimelate decarboxylase [Botrimarina colliarenosi]